MNKISSNLIIYHLLLYSRSYSLCIETALIETLYSRSVVRI